MKLEIPVPVGYDAVLTRHYGDYLTMKQGLSSHDYPVFLKQKEYLDEKLK